MSRKLSSLFSKVFSSGKYVSKSADQVTSQLQEDSTLGQLFGLLQSMHVETLESTITKHPSELTFKQLNPSLTTSDTYVAYDNWYRPEKKKKFRLPKIRSSKKDGEKEGVVKGSVEWMVSFENEKNANEEKQTSSSSSLTWEYSFNVSQNHQLIRIDIKFPNANSNNNNNNSETSSFNLSIFGRSKSSEEWATIYEEVDISQYVFSTSDSILSLSIPAGFVSLSQVQIEISHTSTDSSNNEIDEEDSEEGMESKSNTKKSKKNNSNNSNQPISFNLSVELLQSSSKKSQIDLLQSDSTLSNQIVDLCQFSENSLALRSCALNVLAVMILRDNQQTLEMLEEKIDLQKFLCNFVDGDLVTSNVASQILHKLIAHSTNIKNELGKLLLKELGVLISGICCPDALSEILSLLKVCRPKKYLSTLMEQAVEVGEKLFNSQNPYYTILRQSFQLEGFVLESVPFVVDNDQFQIANNSMWFSPLCPVFMEKATVKSSKLLNESKWDSESNFLTISLKKLTLKQQNTILIDLQVPTLLTAFKLGIDFGYASGILNVSVECYLADPSVAVKAKNFSIDYVSSVQRKEILSSPVLCRYMKITIIPTFNPIEDIQFLSVFPIGWIISELTATQEAMIQTFVQEKSLRYLETRNLLCKSLENYKEIPSDQIQKEYKACSEAQADKHSVETAVEYRALFRNSQKLLNVSFSKQERLTCAAKTILDLLNQSIAKHSSNSTTAPSEPSIPTSPMWDDLTFGLTQNIVNPSSNNNNATSSSTTTTPKSKTSSTTTTKKNETKSSSPSLSWTQIELIFKNYCVHGDSSLRTSSIELLGHYLNDPSVGMEWLPKFINKYFKSPTLHTNVFDEIFEMIRPSNYANAYKELMDVISTSPKSFVESNSTVLKVMVSFLIKIVEESDATLPFHMGVKCGNCGRLNIRGVRYHCANCVGFDLCESCERSAPEIHERTHLFIKIATPPSHPTVQVNTSGHRNKALMPIMYDGLKKKKSKKKNVNGEMVSLSTTQNNHEHDEISCSNCGQSPILGIRFMCVNCQEYNLCESCESHSTHFPTHYFVKVRDPLPALDLEENKLPEAWIEDVNLIPALLSPPISKRASSNNASKATNSILKLGAEVSSLRHSSDQIGTQQTTSLSQSLQLPISNGKLSSSSDELLNNEGNQTNGISNSMTLVSGPTAVFRLICVLSGLTQHQDLLLKSIELLGKMTKVHSYQEIRESILTHPSFTATFLKSMLISNAFVQGSALDLLENLTSIETYSSSFPASTKQTLKTELEKEMDEMNQILRFHLSTMLIEQTLARPAEFLIDSLDLITRRPSTSSTTSNSENNTLTENVKEIKEEKETLDQNGKLEAISVDDDSNWKTRSAPITINKKSNNQPESPTSKETSKEETKTTATSTTTTTKSIQVAPFDSQSTTLLLKFLTTKTVDESTIGYWCTSLQLFKLSDTSFLIKQPLFQKAIDIILFCSSKLQTLLQAPFQELLSHLLKSPSKQTTESAISMLLTQLMEGSSKIVSSDDAGSVYLLKSVVKCLLVCETLFTVSANELAITLNHLSILVKRSTPNTNDKKEDLPNLLFKLTIKLLNASIDQKEKMASVSSLNKSKESIEKEKQEIEEAKKRQQQLLSDLFALTQTQTQTKSSHVSLVAPQELISWLSKQKVKTTKLTLIQRRVVKLLRCLALENEWRKYLITICSNILKQESTDVILLLLKGFLTTDDQVYFAVTNLKLIETLQSIIIRGKNNMSTESKSSKKSKNVASLVSSTAELVGITDSILETILTNPYSGNTWTQKANPTNDFESTITIKLREPVVLKEVRIGGVSKWYLDEGTYGISEYPIMMTVLGGRSLNRMKPYGRSLCSELKENLTSANNNVETYVFQNQFSTVCNYVTIKLKHFDQFPVALNAIELFAFPLKSYNFQSDDSSLEFSIELLAFILSFPSVHLYLVKNPFKDVSWMLDLLGKQSNSQELLFFATRPVPESSVQLVKDILNENPVTLMSAHAELLGKVCSISDKFALDRINILKDFVFNQLSKPDPLSLSIIPLINALAFSIGEHSKLDLKLTSDQIKNLTRYTLATPSKSQMEQSALRLLTTCTRQNTSSYFSMVLDLLDNDSSQSEKEKKQSQRRSSLTSSLSRNLGGVSTELQWFRILGVLIGSSNESGQLFLERQSEGTNSIIETLNTVVKNSTFIDTHLEFLASASLNVTFKEWISENLLKSLLNSWKSVSESTFVDIYFRLLKSLANSHAESQKLISEFLLNEMQDGTLSTKTYTFLERSIEWVDCVYVALHNSDGKILSKKPQTKATDILWENLTDSELSANQITIEGNVVSSQSFSWYTVWADQKMTSGVHCWEIVYMNFLGSTTIGLSEKGIERQTYLGCYSFDLESNQPKSSWGLMGTYFYSTATSGNSKNFGPYPKTGDVMGVILDFEEDTLSFTLNGVFLGIACRGGFAGKELYAGVSLSGVGDRCRIQNYSYSPRGSSGPSESIALTCFPSADSDVSIQRGGVTIFCVPSNMSVAEFEHTLISEISVNSKDSSKSSNSTANAANKKKVKSDSLIFITNDSNESEIKSIEFEFQNEKLKSDISVGELAEQNQSQIIDFHFNTLLSSSFPSNETQPSSKSEISKSELSGLITSIAESKEIVVMIDQNLKTARKQFFGTNYKYTSAFSLVWFDLFSALLQVKGFATYFFSNMEARKFLFKILRKDQIFTSSEGLFNAAMEGNYKIATKMMSVLLGAFKSLFEVSHSKTHLRSLWKSIIAHHVLQKLLGLMAFLCELEEVSSQDKSIELLSDVMEKEKKEKAKSRQAKKSKTPWASGTGYGTGATFDDGNSSFDLNVYASYGKEKSRQQAELFKCLIPLLKNFPKMKDFPAENLFDVLKQSCLLSVLELLLRNDSILDMMKREELYMALFEFLPHIAMNPTLNVLLSTPSQQDSSTTVFSLLAGLTMMSKLVIKTSEKAKKLVKDSASDKPPEELELAHSVLNLNEILQKQKQQQQSPAQVSEKQSPSLTSKTKKTRNRAFSEAGIGMEQSSSTTTSPATTSPATTPTLTSKKTRKRALSEATMEPTTTLNPTTPISKQEKTENGKQTTTTPSSKKEEKVESKTKSEEPNTTNTGKQEEEDEKFEIPKELLSKELEVAYCGALKSSQFEELEMSNPETGRYTHHYSGRMESDGGVPSSKMQRLVGELSSLSNNLPLNLHSSVFLRIDSERPDLMTALITGPIATPYSNGCFEFHIYCPSNYPQGPPLVNLETTGNGLVRFNPNLYNDGKVCLSLLGTWQGAQNEQWSAQSSTLLQVLVSIQSLIFVEKPYFNEPGYENQMNSLAGRKANNEYNDNIRLQTLNWAILNQLKNPSKGFEKVIKMHFALKKEAILKEISKWQKQSHRPSDFDSPIEEFKQLVSNLSS